METWIDESQYERIQNEDQDSVTIEGGYDSFERVDIRDSDDSTIHIFKISKETELFEITIHWAVDMEDEDPSDEELKDLSKKQLRTESSYYTSNYLLSMDLPPLQGLFFEQLSVEMVPDEDENSDVD